MNFDVPTSHVAPVLVLAAVGGALLLWAEWRRADRRRRALRLGASVLAVAALALWGLRPTHPAPGRTTRGRQAVVLWTRSQEMAAGSRPRVAGKQFALPDAVAAPKDATTLPDVAALLRRVPDAGSVHILGGGLEPYDLELLRGRRVEFSPPPPVGEGVPAITFLRCPRTLGLGGQLTVQGRVAGLPPGKTADLILVAPDGSTLTAATSPADAHGAATFLFHAPSPGAAGTFSWRLKLTHAGALLSDEALAVAVVPPDLGRVLVLETTPRFDTASLRRWYEAAGGTLTARVQVGKNLYRFYGSAPAGGGTPPEFPGVDAALLDRYDLVVTDGRALAALQDAERSALRTAVAGRGLGVLTLADADAVKAATADPPTADDLLPWRLRPVAGGPTAEDARSPENTDRPVRVRWPGMPVASDNPADAAPFEIAPLPPGADSLVRDDQNRVLAASVPVGRGQLALTLVRDTGRWLRANDLAAFAAYWSHLCGTLARHDDAAGFWSLTGDELGPVYVDQPLELVWHGPPSGQPSPALVTNGSAEPPVRLPLIQDATEPGRWRGTFWPRRAGWHRVVAAPRAPSSQSSPSPVAATLDFHVAAPDAWPALAAARRREATARFASASAAVSPEQLAGNDHPSVPVAPGWWFALFLLGAGTLWIERRFAGPGQRSSS